MTEHEASRTLVKSPPELWAECSEAASLARHLGQFGEIRITKLDPETAVAWEGEEVSGTVRLEPSGWGTRVILTASATEEQQTPAPVAGKPTSKKAPIQEPEAAESELKDPAVKEPSSAGEPDPVEEHPSAEEPQPVEEPPPPPDPEPEPLPPAASPTPPAVDSEPEATPPRPVEPPPQPVRRRGLMAKLMALFQPPEPAPAPTAPVSTPPPGSNGARASTPPPLSSTPPPETRPAAAPRPAASSGPSVTPPVSPDPPDPPDPSEPPDLEVADTVDHVAVLSAALDSLGQAHHRPFSRA
jgi:hypothetical protein